MNDKRLRGHVPPFHLSFCRAFINFDGHKIKHGLKVVASSVKRKFRHVFNHNHIFLAPEYSYEMNGLPLNDFRNMLEYYL